MEGIESILGKIKQKASHLKYENSQFELNKEFSFFYKRFLDGKFTQSDIDEYVKDIENSTTAELNLIHMMRFYRYSNTFFDDVKNMLIGNEEKTELMDLYNRYNEKLRIIEKMDPKTTANRLIRYVYITIDSDVVIDEKTFTFYKMRERLREAGNNSSDTFLKKVLHVDLSL